MTPLDPHGIKATGATMSGMQGLTMEQRAAMADADALFTRWRKPVPVALSATPPPIGPSIMVDADGHTHLVWARDGGFSYTRDGADPLAVVREVVGKYIGEDELASLIEARITQDRRGRWRDWGSAFVAGARFFA